MARQRQEEASASSTDAGADQASVSNPDENTTPVSLVVLAPYGFIDDYGDRWHWNVGDIVRNPYVVGMLQERSAPVQEV